MAVAMTLFATYQIWWVLRGDGISMLEGVLLALFVALFAWIALSFSSALAGFALLLSKRPHPLGIDEGHRMEAILRIRFMCTDRTGHWLL